jgi:enoyl-CoA hydratase/carnithine racemase
MVTVIDHDDIQELRLNRPPVNALSTELLSALREAHERATRQSRAVIISGTPGMFSAGLDIPLLLKLDRNGMAQLWRELYAVMRTLATSPVPTCAAITGHAPAGGTVIALFCDFRVAARGDFKLGLSEVQAGIPLPPVLLRALQRQVGARQAERLAVAGLMLSPEQALSAGLVDELAPPEEVPERAVAWCRSLLAVPQRAMSVTRRLARTDLVTLFETTSEEELQMVLDNWWSEETQGVLRALAARLGK